MAKVVIAGNAVVINSSLKLDDIKTVEKYRPERLILKSDDGNEKPVFRIGVAKQGLGSLSAYGAMFSANTQEPNGQATITMVIENIDDSSDIKEMVVDEFGSALISLSKLEQKLPEVINEINSSKDVVRGSISVVA